MRFNPKMTTLGIESTCDETGVALVRDGNRIIANVVSSSILMHQKYGGVVPEVAAREQIKVIIPCLKEALESVGNPQKSIDAIAVSYGPGLVGSLLVGVETAKTLALIWDKPLIAVNHLLGHIYANWVNQAPKFPLVALVVSGGHTDLILMKRHGTYRWLGGTLDDAAGEAFDKVARVLGLGYPGGPEIEKLASQSEKSTVKLPRPKINDNDFDFSFSGLKTAVINLVHSSPRSATNFAKASMVKKASRGEQFVVHGKGEIAFEFQNAICDVLVKKTVSAAMKFGVRSIVVGGGVAANSVLRHQMSDAGRKNGIDVYFPPKEMAVDNGAMIAAAAFYNQEFVDPLKLQADPGLHFA